MAKLKKTTAAQTTAVQEAPDVKKVTLPTGDYYQEWEVKITAKTTGEGDTKKTTFDYEKMKLKREVVKITEEEAETLNAGRLTGGNTYTTMFFPVKNGSEESETENDNENDE